jgi:hypothetical protein
MKSRSRLSAVIRSSALRAALMSTNSTATFDLTGSFQVRVCALPRLYVFLSLSLITDTVSIRSYTPIHLCYALFL